jgi:trigger factor
LNTGEDEPFGPGFSEALVGANVGESREFEITYPDDEKTGENLRGKQAKFYATVKKIEVVTLPALNDDLAARLTKDEEKPLSLLELRVRVRENLVKAAEDQAKSDFARDAVEALVKDAQISYPEVMVADQVQSMLEDFDRDLRQRAGLRLEDYKTIYKKTDEDLFNEFRESAVRTLERSLVLGEVLKAEAMDISDERINEEIGRIAGQFGDGGDQIRKMFQKQSMRDNLKNDLLRDEVLNRIVAIAKGELVGTTLAVPPVTTGDAAAEEAVAPSSDQEPPNVAEEKGESVQE